MLNLSVLAFHKKTSESSAILYLPLRGFNRIRPTILARCKSAVDALYRAEATAAELATGQSKTRIVRSRTLPRNIVGWDERQVFVDDMFRVSSCEAAAKP